MDVRLSISARQELEAIGDYIAADSRMRADAFVRELVERCAGLSNYPDRYPVITDYRGERVRRAPYGSYLIFYSVREDEIRVHHIVHSARDYVRLLFPDD